MTTGMSVTIVLCSRLTLPQVYELRWIRVAPQLSRFNRLISEYEKITPVLVGGTKNKRQVRDNRDTSIDCCSGCMETHTDIGLYTTTIS